MPVLIIGGPTAAGKSDLAVELAQRFDARIVSADAMTVYRRMDIATAKPPPEILAVVPHELIDIREPDEDFTVDDFELAVRALCATGERVIIVGGTPFYLSALVRPMAPLPAADPELRTRLEALADPHAELQRRDPRMAEKLHPNDRVRIVRALEVIELSGEPMSTLQAAPPRRPPLEAGVIWLDPPGLRERIDLRLEKMVAAGYREETAELLERFGPEIKPMRAFAYRHMAEHLTAGLDLQEAIWRTARDSWKLARKQRTWARGLGWHAAEPEEIPAVVEKVFPEGL